MVVIKNHPLALGFMASQLYSMVASNPIPKEDILLNEGLSIPSTSALNTTAAYSGTRFQKRAAKTMSSYRGLQGTFLATDAFELVQNQMHKASTHSWEIGYESIELLELENAALDVFGNQCIPPTVDNSITTPFELVSPLVKNISEGQLMIVNDSSVGDPASLGTIVSLGAMIGGSNINQFMWSKAVYNQVDYLINHAPRGSTGAISHRRNEVQYWADFVFMAPPFLAYYGAETQNLDLIRFAAKQVDLYRALLQGQDTSLWTHIQDGTPGVQDHGLWATGNAWAVQGATRILAIMINGPFVAKLQPEINMLASITWNIVDEVYNVKMGKSGNLFPNYFDGTGPDYSDATSTAMMTAAAYRLDILGVIPDGQMDAVHATRSTLLNCIDDTGIVAPVVNPENWKQDDVFDGVSPEGQTAMVAMENAYRAWVATKQTGASADQLNSFGPNSPTNRLWSFTDPLWP